MFGLLCVSTASVVNAQQNQGGNSQGNNDNQGNFNLTATPELDSFALFGAGLLGVAGYAITRYRARR